MHDPATFDALTKMHPLGRPSSPARSSVSTVVNMPDTDALRDALDRWKAAIAEQQPEKVAEVFTEDAIFQGLAQRSYSVGRQAVIDYYASQPPGMTVDYQILQARPLARSGGRIPPRRIPISRPAHSQPVPRRGDQPQRGRPDHRLLPGVPAPARSRAWAA